MKTVYFENINTLQELKKAYFKLAKIHHPDVGGDIKVMQAVNNEYDKLFDLLKSKINYDNYSKEESQGNYTYKEETNDIFRDIISKVIHFEGIELEICGYWLWMSGNTKEYKDILKSIGFKWSSNKFMWYWRHENYRSFNRKKHSIDEIREMYGSTKVKKDKEQSKISA